MPNDDHVLALEIGGTHSTAAVVDLETWSVVGASHRADLDAGADAEPLLDAFVSPARSLAVPSAAMWGVAMPDPFDYRRGVALFRGVGKFESLCGVDVRSAMITRSGARDVRFGNDADAFTLGEWVRGAAAGAERCAGLTLGTGVGTGWVAAGAVVDPGDPPDGRAHRLTIGDQALEDVMSRRAVRRAYEQATGADLDVREITDRARAGEDDAVRVLAGALRGLGGALAPRFAGFGADVVVIGGSMAASWDILEPWFREGAGTLPELKLAADPEQAPLIGAAYGAAGDCLIP
jgi:glucokinase